MSEVRRSSRVRNQPKEITETESAKPSKAKRAKKEELADTEAFKKFVKKTRIPKSLLEETAPSDDDSEQGMSFIFPAIGNISLENESEESSGDENKNKMSMAERIRMKIKQNEKEGKKIATVEEEYDEPVSSTKVSLVYSQPLKYLHKSKKGKTDKTAKKRKREPAEGIVGGFHIGQKRYATVKQDADEPYLDIRQYYENKSKELIPTTRGVTLNKSQWEKICEDMPNIGQRIVSTLS